MSECTTPEALTLSGLSYSTFMRFAHAKGVPFRRSDGQGAPIFWDRDALLVALKERNAVKKNWTQDNQRRAARERAFASRAHVKQGAEVTEHAERIAAMQAQINTSDDPSERSRLSTEIHQVRLVLKGACERLHVPFPAEAKAPAPRASVRVQSGSQGA